MQAFRHSAESLKSFFCCWWLAIQEYQIKAKHRDHLQCLCWYRIWPGGHKRAAIGDKYKNTTWWLSQCSFFFFISFFFIWSLTQTGIKSWSFNLIDNHVMNWGINVFYLGLNDTCLKHPFFFHFVLNVVWLSQWKS